MDFLDRVREYIAENGEQVEGGYENIGMNSEVFSHILNPEDLQD